MKQVITSKYVFKGQYLERKAKFVLLFIISGLIISASICIARFMIIKDFVTKIPVDGLKAVDIMTR